MRDASDPEKKAIAVLKKAGVVAAPVPVEELADGLGAEISYEPYDGEVSGMLYRSEDRPPLIGINSKHPPNRQRFSVAHEIGHLVMHEGQSVFVDRFVRVNWRDGTSHPEEAEANAFAAELLMPRDLVADEIEAAISKREAITPQQLASQLARKFKVSTQAMSYRLENLGIVDPAALVS